MEAGHWETPARREHGVCMEPEAGACPTPGWGDRAQSHGETPERVQTGGYQPQLPPLSSLPHPWCFPRDRRVGSKLAKIPKPPRPAAPRPAGTASLGAASLKLGRRRQSPEPEQARSLKRKGSATAANPAAGAGEGGRRPRDARRNAKHPTAQARPAWGWDGRGMSEEGGNPRFAVRISKLRARRPALGTSV